MTTYQTQLYRLKQLFSTLAAATASNPVLLEGEKWNEKDAATGRATGRTKTGDGVVSGTPPNQAITGTAFTDLPFDPSPGGGGATNLSIVNRTDSALTIASSTGDDADLLAATASLAGLQSALDKAKLNSIASGATANSSDATLLARANHTGTQTAATITGLATVATSGSYGDLTGLPTLFDPASPGAIGGTAAGAGTFTALSASTSLLLPSAAANTPTAGHVYRVADQLRYRDSSNAEQVVLYGAGNLANLTNTATARGNLSAVGTVTTGVTGATQVINIISLSQANYDAIVTKDAQILYIITG
jgi:hypothetical protein